MPQGKYAVYSCIKSLHKHFRVSRECEQTSVRNTHRICKGVSVPTSTGVMFPEELLQWFPASTNSHHHRAPQNPHQSQLLRVSKLYTQRIIHTLFINPYHSSIHTSTDARHYAHPFIKVSTAVLSKVIKWTNEK